MITAVWYFFCAVLTLALRERYVEDLRRRWNEIHNLFQINISLIHFTFQRQRTKINQKKIFTAHLYSSETLPLTVIGEKMKSLKMNTWSKFEEDKKWVALNITLQYNLFYSNRLIDY